MTRNALVLAPVLRSETQARLLAALLLRAGESPLVGPLAGLLLLGYGPRKAVEDALDGIPGIEQAFIGGSWAARYAGQPGPFPRDIDVIVVGQPDRDNVAEAVTEALRSGGNDSQVVFRSCEAWLEAADAFTRTAQAGPLIEIAVGSHHG